MVDITYQMVLSTLQTIALIVGIVYYLFIMRNSQRTQEPALKAQEQALENRQLQLYNTLIPVAQSRDLYRSVIDVTYFDFESYDDFMEKYGPISNPEAYVSLAHVGELYQAWGVMVEQKAINPARARWE